MWGTSFNPLQTREVSADRQATGLGCARVAGHSGWRSACVVGHSSRQRPRPARTITAGAGAQLRALRLGQAGGAAVGQGVADAHGKALQPVRMRLHLRSRPRQSPVCGWLAPAETAVAASAAARPRSSARACRAARPQARSPQTAQRAHVLVCAPGASRCPANQATLACDRDSPRRVSVRLRVPDRQGMPASLLHADPSRTPLPCTCVPHTAPGGRQPRVRTANVNVVELGPADTVYSKLACPAPTGAL
jgi:hypothetical protein